MTEIIITTITCMHLARYYIFKKKIIKNGLYHRVRAYIQYPSKFCSSTFFSPTTYATQKEGFAIFVIIIIIVAIVMIENFWLAPEPNIVLGSAKSKNGERVVCYYIFPCSFFKTPKLSNCLYRTKYYYNRLARNDQLLRSTTQELDR